MDCLGIQKALMQQKNVESEEHGRRCSEFLEGLLLALNCHNHVREIFSVIFAAACCKLLCLACHRATWKCKTVVVTGAMKKVSVSSDSLLVVEHELYFLFAVSVFVQFLHLWVCVYDAPQHPPLTHTHRHADSSRLPLLIYPSGCLSAQEKAQS